MKSTPCSTAARTTRTAPSWAAGSPPPRGPGQRRAAVAEPVDGEVPADAEGVTARDRGHRSPREDRLLPGRVPAGPTWGQHGSGWNSSPEARTVSGATTGQRCAGRGRSDG